MATQNELAIFAFNAYRPRIPGNFIELTGWTRSATLSRANRGAGFDGSVFLKGPNPDAPQEIVISFRGTDGPTPFDWAMGNIPAAAGYDWGQVYKAIELVADTMAAHPGVPITLSGHSLGGGLASLMAVFFGLTAHTFDPAPFELSAVGMAAYPLVLPMQLAGLALFPTDLVESFFEHYRMYQLRNGRANQISEAFEHYRDVLASEDREDIDALFAQRQANVTGTYLSGEVLEELREVLPTIISTAPDALHEIDVGETTLGGIDLHGMLLLTAAQISPLLAQASRQQPALLELLLDESLYATPNTSTRQGFLNRLITMHMSEGAQPGQGILDRFAQDVISLGIEGTTRHVLMRDALIALVIEYYRFADQADTDPFIGAAPNSVTFDTSRLPDGQVVSGDGTQSGRGRARLLDAVVALADSELSGRIRTAAEDATQWRIHSGSVALVTSGTDDDEVQIGSLIHSNTLRGGAGNDLLVNGNAGGTLEGGADDDVLIGGNGADLLYGGAGADSLAGGASDDSLIGGTGSDELFGGEGDDNYNFFLGDGSDIVIDSDGAGAIYVEGAQLQAGARTGENTWISSDGLLTITRLPMAVHGGTNLSTLVIRDAAGTLNITVRSWENGQLGLNLNFGDYADAGETSGDIAPPSGGSTAWPPTAQVVGAGTVTSFLDYDNVAGSTGADRIFGLGGNDSLLGREGDDYLDGGDGRDLLFGGAGKDVLVGGEGGDMIVGDRGNVTLTYEIGSQYGEVYLPGGTAVVYNGLGWGIEIFGPSTLITSHLLRGVSTTYAAGEADIIDAGNGDDSIMSGDGDDVVSGGDGDDEIVAEAGDDNVQGGAGDDVMLGDGQRADADPNVVIIYSPITTQGRDVLHGGDGADYIVGGGNADRIFGDDGGDTLFGDDVPSWSVLPTLHGDDLLDGGAGSDFLTGNGGDDTLYGGNDADTLRGDADVAELAGEYHGDDFLSGDAGNDGMKGGGGSDRLFGGSGNDLMYGDEDSGGFTALDASYQGDDLLDGGADDDVMAGGGGADTMYGGSGNDLLFGDQGSNGLSAAAQRDDYIDGGEGVDQIAGGGGADTLLGGEGDDHIEGDDIEARTPFSAHGADYIDAGAGNDLVFGWAGNDFILGGSGADQLLGDAGTDVMAAQYHGNDYISGGAGNDILWGMGGNDLLYGNEDDDQLDGDDGVDVTLFGDDYLDGGSGNDHLWGRGGNDILVGAFGNDTMFGNEGNDELSGDSGNDSMDGGIGNDVLDGGSGTDVMLGGEGADTIEGGSGNDTLNGGLGDDIYRFGTGDGQDFINDAGGTNRMVFDGGVTRADLYFYYQPYEYAPSIAYYSARDRVSINAGLAELPTFEFADGTSFTYLLQVSSAGEPLTGTAAADILLDEAGGLESTVLDSGAGDDSVIGGTGDDELIGGTGADLMYGGAGNDTYHFNRGDGRDLILQIPGLPWDFEMIEFGLDITWSDLVFSAVNNDLVISIAGSQDSITLDDWFSSSDIHRVDYLLVDGGYSIWDRANLVSVNLGTYDDDVLYGDDRGSLTLQGLTGNDTLDAGAGNETLDGGIGNDSLWGGDGNDTYMFRRSDGQDTLGETSGSDQIVFADINRADLTFERVNNNLVIQVSGSMDRLTIQSFWQSTGAGLIEELVFADGTRMSAREIIELGLVPAATSGDDTFYDGPGDHTLFGLDGNDLIDGGSGDDTIDGGAGNDRLYGGVGDNVLVGGSGNDELHGGGEDELYGGDGNDTLVGGSGNDVLDGGAGNDSLYGGDGSYTEPGKSAFTGNDTFLFGIGSGQDTIHGGPGDRVVFGSSVSASNVLVSRSNYDLVLTIAGTSDQITLSSWFRGPGYQLDQFVFADGSTLPPVSTIYDNLLTYVGDNNANSLIGNSDAEIIRGLGGSDSISANGGNDIVEGGDGDDSLFGQDGLDQLFGGAGNDTLRGQSGHLLDGGAGNDALFGRNGTVYVFGRGYGQDTITNFRGSSSESSIDGILDRITFTAGTTASEVLASRNGNNLVLGIGGTPDTLTITGWFTSSSNRFDRIEFADGTRLASAQEITDSLSTQIPSVGTVINGTSGADTLSGSAAIETLYGLAGNDSLTGGNSDLLVGGAGSDTYLYNRGAGQVAIYDYDLADVQSGSAIDQVVFGGDISASDITMQRTGNDLVLTVNGGSDRLVVRNWFAGASYQVQFVFADSSSLPSPEQIYTNLLSQTGTAGNDTLKAYEGNDLISGGQGSDTINGGSGDDTLRGDEGNDKLYGEWGSDVLIGGVGSDTLYGYAGDDTLVGEGDGDSLLGGAGNDTLDGGLDGVGDGLQGGPGDDTYVFGRGYGSDHILESFDLGDNSRVQFGVDVSASDILFSRDDDDLILTIGGTSDQLTIEQWFAQPHHFNFEFEFEDGSHVPSAQGIYDLTLTQVGDNLANELYGYEGNDILSGLAGNDTLSGYNGSDILYGGDGNDTISGDHPTSNFAQGMTHEDALYGQAGDDTLKGGLGDDLLDGGMGNDTLEGGGGNDTYVYSLGYGRDSINDFSQYDADPYVSGYATDQVVFGAGIAVDRVLVTRIGNDLNIRVNDADRLTITGWFLGNRLEEFHFADGTALTSAQMEARIGAVLNNVAPTLVTPIADQAALEDSVFSLQIPPGTFADPDAGDTTTYTATRVGGAALPAWLTFDPISSTFSGTPTNADVQSFDVVVTATDALGALVTDAFAITVQNTNDAPILAQPIADGVAREGNLYVMQFFSWVFFDVDSGDTLTFEAELDGGAALPAWLTFDANTRTFSGTPGEADVGTLQIRVRARDSSGASVSDVFALEIESALIQGTGGADVLDGTSLGDRIVGLGGDDTLNGNGGNDLLDGGTGNDTMRGHSGDDTYIVDSTSDNLMESSNQGTDTVRSSVNWTLGSNFEHLVLLGTGNLTGNGNSLANNIAGNSGNNTINGNSGADTMAGGAGADTYIVENAGDVVIENAGEGIDLVQSSVGFTLGTNVENLTLTGTSGVSGTGNTLDNVLIGNSGSNTLVGGDGNDTLNGGSGTDTMIGGQGNDTYIVAQAGDATSENAGEGIDLVQSSVTYALAANVENLTLTGSSTINGTGNGLDNVLTGNSANNTLTGQAGNDTLDGGSGTDIMVGGQGNDIYFVNVSADQTNENTGEGIDTVNSSVTRTLAANIELLFLTGTSAINGTGNGLSNLLRGNGMNNTLAGGGAIDILEGALGNDTLSNASGNTLLNGGVGTDTLTGTSSNDMLIGGAGNDVLTTGQGADIIVFNMGDGQDTVAASTTRDNTVTLGGGALYADLLFRKNGNDLILQLGATDEITFTGYYTSTSNRSVNTLQVVIEGTGDYDSGSADATRNKKIQSFNFEGLVAAFDAARTANPTLTTWALTNALLAQHLSGSDTAAIGGDLAYRYGRFGNLSDISFTPAVGILGAAGFGTSAQTLQSLANLQDVSVRLS